ncbi:hypothetical protein AB0G04_37405 [Actinoplanes sp. NPDC023801]|uniref:hypothetical protein n=1 Tax=Actinoplanes sp. NPDC023801 TaxID=3154595 RepID=UPI0033C74B3D
MLSDLERVAPAFLAHRSATVLPIDWELIGNHFGLTYPADYVAYRSHYTHLTIDDFMMITGPVPGQERGYIAGVEESLELVRDFAADDMTEGFQAYPEPGGVFPWGASNEGDMFFWRVNGPDPDAWTCVVSTRNGDWWEHDGGALSLVVGLIDGSVEHWGLPPQPRPDPPVA